MYAKYGSSNFLSEFVVAQIFVFVGIDFYKTLRHVDWQSLYGRPIREIYFVFIV